MTRRRASGHAGFTGTVARAHSDMAETSQSPSIVRSRPHSRKLTRTPVSPRSMPVTGQPSRTRSPSFSVSAWVMFWFPPSIRYTSVGKSGTPRIFRMAACHRTCRAEPWSSPKWRIAASEAPSFRSSSFIVIRSRWSSPTPNGWYSSWKESR